jgi:hypothetical protein
MLAGTLKQTSTGSLEGDVVMLSVLVDESMSSHSLFSMFMNHVRLVSNLGLNTSLDRHDVP